MGMKDAVPSGCFRLVVFQLSQLHHQTERMQWHRSIQFIGCKCVIRSYFHIHQPIDRIDSVLFARTFTVEISAQIMLLTIIQHMLIFHQPFLLVVFDYYGWSKLIIWLVISYHTYIYILFLMTTSDYQQFSMIVWVMINYPGQSTILDDST